MNLLLENNIKAGISSVKGDRYVKSDETKTILRIVANKLYECAMSESLLSDGIEFDENVKLERKLKPPDDSGIGYFVEVDSKYPVEIKEKICIIYFAQRKKSVFMIYLLNLGLRSIQKIVQKMRN